jgi:cell wall-associated NlpC family hydrolase
MNRLIRLVVVAATFVLVLPTMFPEVARATVEDQRREVERIVDQLDRLGEQADILAEDYAEAVDNLSQLTVDVAAAEQRVAAQEAELDQLRGNLSEVAIRSLTGSGTDVLGPLFSNAEMYSDGLRRDQFSRVALAVGTGTTDDLDELISTLDAERKDLESKRAQVVTLKATIEDKQRQTLESTAEYEQQRDAAQARLGQAIADEEQRRAEAAFAKLQAELAAQQAAAAASSAASASDSGGGGNTSSSSSGGNSSSSGGNSSSSGGNASSSGGGEAAAAPASQAQPPPVTNIPAVSGRAGIAIEAALSQQGVAYRYATSNPGVSFDCSGLTHYAWGQAGVYLPRNSRAQAAATPRVPTAAAQPGDLIFYYSPISHVGIYLGGGQLVHAPNSGTVVKVASVSWGKVTAVGRPG